MIARRLTKIQKDQIVESYRGGDNAETLAKKYSCSASTINRTVKMLLSDVEYKFLKGKRSKNINKSIELVKNESDDNEKEIFDDLDFFNSSHQKVYEKEQVINANDEFENSDFEEIVPLISSFDFEKEEIDFEIHTQDKLPESVYMLVDKKVELEFKPISEFPEWSFLPESELERNAIFLFLNQRSAKRSCSRNQRVIKIPNTNVFQFSKSYLIAKGITRLVLDDFIIALDD